MCDKILDKINTNTKICDPCVGDGVFLNICQRRVSKKQLFGYDIDENKIKNLKKFSKYK